jgi:Mrp family chromosome partitioning ATPase
VASPRLATSAQLNGSALLAVDTSETVQSLRRALKAGAKGFFLWPADRGELARAAARVFARGAQEVETLGRVVAVHGPRGGAGATFVATHLAASFARRERRDVPCGSGKFMFLIPSSRLAALNLQDGYL